MNKAERDKWRNIFLECKGAMVPSNQMLPLLDYVDALEAALRAIDHRQAQLANEDDVDKCYDDIEQIIREVLDKGKE